MKQRKLMQLACAVVCLVVLTVGCANPAGSDDDGDGIHTIRFEVTGGPKPASVQYFISSWDGTTRLAKAPALPWEYTSEAAADDGVSFSVTPRDADSGGTDVTMTLYQDGSPVASTDVLTGDDPGIIAHTVGDDQGEVIASHK